MRRPAHGCTFLLALLATSVSAAEGVETGLPTSVAELDDLVALALARHPALAAYTARAEDLRAGGVALGALPEPVVTVSPLGEMAQTAAGEVEIMLGLSQRIPGPGKRAAMEAERVAEAGVPEAERHARAVAVAFELRRAWWRQREAVAITEVVRAQQALLEDLRSTVATRVEANLASSAQLLRLAVESGELEARLVDLDRARAVAASQLRRSLALAVDAAIPAVERGPEPRLPAPELLAAAAERQHPALRLSAAEAAVAAARERSASVRRRPDFTLFANYNVVDDEGLSMAATGEDQWWVGVGVSVPLWGGRYAAGERAAGFAARRATLRRLAARDQIAADLAAAGASWDAVTAQLALYRDRLRPAAVQALEAERGRYAAGEGGFADLLMAARQLLAVELELVRLEHGRGIAAAELLAAAGLVASDDVEEAEDE